MLNIQYFASLRETLGRSSETLALPEDGSTVATLAAYLATSRGGQWEILLDATQVLVAVNQTIVDRSHPLTGAEELAFFPPMTGG
jgi:molybdopterin synthase sulfur carrier subunit